MSERLDDLKAALAGRYEIDREIGQGGMATVYLARDVRHNRQVAVKVLRSDLAAALGHERFLREIEIAAKLTHPHILPLYDSGEADGFLYYVMPYIAGDTLRDRIEKEGELPITEAVRIIREVTDALAFAHSQGVVHRDIKPDNVMLSGRHAMVTDFGVAKAVSEATGRNTLTTAGVALGTPTYMAPEQATADPHVDHRADIYAVGVMAYELLAGRTPFQGASPQAVLAAHVTEQAEPVSKHRDQVTPDLETVVMRCLAKKPADRWQSAEEMLPALETMTTSSGGLTPTATRPVHGIAPARPRRMWWMALGAAAAVTVIAVFGARLITDDALTVRVASVRQVTHAPTMELFPDISDDGQEIVYTAGRGVTYRLFVRDVEGGPALGLTDDTPGLVWFPRWAPDGRHVRFMRLGNLIPGVLFPTMEIPKFGGQERQISMTLLGESGVAELHSRGLDSVEVRSHPAGETLAVLTVPPGTSWGELSPDGTRVAYVLGNQQYYAPDLLGNDVPTSIWVGSLDGGAPVRVTPDAFLDTEPHWVGNDRLLFISNREGRRDIYLVELRASGEPAGEPVRVTAGSDVHTFSVTPDGSRLALSELRFRANLYQIDLPATGPVSLAEARPLTRETAVIEQHHRSADGEWLAYDSNIQGQQDIYLVPAAGGAPRRVTTSPGQDMDPELSPDGSEIVFYSTRHGTRDLFTIGVDGQNLVRLTGDPADGWGENEQEIFPSFSPDGLHIAFATGSYQDYRVMVMSREAVGAPWGPARELAASTAPFVTWELDSRHILTQDPEYRVLRIAIEGGEPEVLPVEGVTEPSWPTVTPDGHLFFRGTDGNGVRGIYRDDRSGAPPRMVVRFDDSRFVSESYGVTVIDDVLTLTVSEKESDVYLMDLEY